MALAYFWSNAADSEADKIIWNLTDQNQLVQDDLREGRRIFRHAPGLIISKREGRERKDCQHSYGRVENPDPKFWCAQQHGQHDTGRVVQQAHIWQPSMHTQGPSDEVHDDHHSKRKR